MEVAETVDVAWLDAQLQEFAQKVSDAAVELGQARNRLSRAMADYNRFIGEYVGCDALPLYTPIESCGFSRKVYNCLKRAGINRLEDILAKTGDDLLKIRNLGPRFLEEITSVLRSAGYAVWCAGIDEHREVDLQ